MKKIAILTMIFALFYLFLSLQLSAELYAQGDVILWNKLGSDTEVRNSEIGADFTIKNDSTGDVFYVDGRFGGALATTGGEIGPSGGYLTMNADDFFPWDRSKGCVEVWVQKRLQEFSAYQTPMVCIFGHVPYGSGYDAIMGVWTDDSSGPKGMAFIIIDSNDDGHVAYDLGWNDVPIGEWVHMAYVWDLNGIEGSTDRLRIYRDGAMVGAYTGNVPDIKTDLRDVVILGHHMYSRFGEPTAYLDNIVVWNYPKNEFSFTESPLCESVTGNNCVDNACCVVDNIYEDPGRLFNHGKYVNCVVTAAKECGLKGSKRGYTIRKAAKSKVNK